MKQCQWRDVTEVSKIMYSFKQGAGSWKNVTKLYLQQSNELCFSVPFQHVPTLVGKRKVYMKDGLAHVPYSKLREAIRELFSELMSSVAKQAQDKLPLTLKDERIKNLWRMLKVKK